MALKSELMAVGMPAALANRIGFDPLTTFAAAGSGQNSATKLTANAANVTSGSGGVILASFEQPYFVANNSGGSITVYPPVGGTFNGGSLNAGITVGNTKSFYAEPVGNSNLFGSLSA